jgi:hypothetical protein
MNPLKFNHKQHSAMEITQLKVGISIEKLIFCLLLLLPPHGNNLHSAIMSYECSRIKQQEELDLYKKINHSQRCVMQTLFVSSVIKYYKIVM